MTTFAQDLSGYNGSKLRRDVAAGITVATLAVPQAMAYATIADINPIYGLYSAIVVTMVASMFNSCSRLIYGPTNAICIMIADIHLIHVMDRFGIAPSEFMRVVFLLTFMVGAIEFGAGLFRLGYFATFISPSVIGGFTVGAAVLIIIKQIPKILSVDVPDPLPEVAFLGLPIPEQMESVRLLFYSLSNASGASAAAVIMAIACAVFTLAYRNARQGAVRIRRSQQSATRLVGQLLFYLPGPLLAILAASLATVLFSLDARGVELVHLIPGRLPPLSVPLFRFDLMQALFPSALAIAIVGLIEAVSTAKVQIHREREPFSANGQFMGEAFGNMVGSFFSSFAGSSSFTRSALNMDVGAATRLSGIFAGLSVAAFMLLFSPLFNYIPSPALSGVLVAVGLTLIRSQQILSVVRGSRSDALIVVVTALWAIAFSLDGAILFGIVLSVLAYMPRVATLTSSYLIRDEDGVLREKAPREPQCSELCVMEIEGVFFFGALPSLEKILEELSAQPQKIKILRLYNAQHLDAAAASELARFIREEHAKGNRIMLSGIRNAHEASLRRQGIYELVGDENLFFESSLTRTSTVQAVGAAYLRIGPHSCKLCAGEEKPKTDSFTYMI